MGLLDQATQVIFDMDGVLLDTEPLYTIAYDRVMAPYGARLDWETKSTMMGRAALASARLVIEKFGLPLTPEELLARREPILQELFENAPAMPGAPELIAKLKARGCRLAVATSSFRPLFELKTRRHSWFSHFDAIVCGDDPRVKNPKPAPDIFLAAAERLGVTADKCVIFEDSPSGVEAALASGARVIALVDPQMERTAYRGAHLVIEKYAELD
jgi:pseudouridine-5'-monophosphatase